MHEHEADLVHRAADPATTTATATTSATTTTSRLSTRSANHRSNTVDVDSLVNDVSVFDPASGFPGSLPSGNPGTELQHVTGERAERLQRPVEQQRAVGDAQHTSRACQRRSERKCRRIRKGFIRFRSNRTSFQAVRSSQNEPDGRNPGGLHVDTWRPATAWGSRRKSLRRDHVRNGRSTAAAAKSGSQHDRAQEPEHASHAVRASSHELQQQRWTQPEASQPSSHGAPQRFGQLLHGLQ